MIRPRVVYGPTAAGHYALRAGRRRRRAPGGGSAIWLTQGYARIDPDIPVIADPAIGGSYNDVYLSDLTDAMHAAIRAVDELGFVDVDRLGHGGHSYGGFATMNFLASTPYIKAGIAGDGASNRTLTPGGFQCERRCSGKLRTRTSRCRRSSEPTRSTHRC
ncbi:MAG: alpha/beta hydrolase family protein [Planctomycetaceae bacterium]